MLVVNCELFHINQYNLYSKTLLNGPFIRLWHVLWTCPLRGFKFLDLPNKSWKIPSIERKIPLSIVFLHWFIHAVVITTNPCHSRTINFSKLFNNYTAAQNICGPLTCKFDFFGWPVGPLIGVRWMKMSENGKFQIYYTLQSVIYRPFSAHFLNLSRLC